MKRASIVSRILASLIDIYISAFITTLLVFLIINWLADNVIVSVGISLIALMAITSIVFKDVVNGRSIGKRLFGLGVRELDHTVPSRKKLISRNLSSLFWPKDIYYLLFSDEKRKQGDLRNGTDVYQIGAHSKTKKVLTIVISLILLAGLFIGGILTMIKQDASYNAAINFIENDASIQERVGNDIRFGFFPSGSISRSNGHGVASFKVKVTGDKDSLSVFITLMKEPNQEWKVSRVRY